MKTNRPDFRSTGQWGKGQPVYVLKVAGWNNNITPAAAKLLRSVVSGQGALKFQCDKSGSSAMFTARFPGNESVSFSLPKASCARIQQGQRVSFTLSLQGQNEFVLYSELIDANVEERPRVLVTALPSPAAPLNKVEIQPENCDPLGRTFPTEEAARQAIIDLIARNGGRFKIELVATQTERPRRVLAHVFSEYFYFGLDPTGKAYEFEANIYCSARDKVRQGQRFYVWLKEYREPFTIPVGPYDLPGTKERVAGNYFSADFGGVAHQEDA